MADEKRRTAQSYPRVSRAKAVPDVIVVEFARTNKMSDDGGWIYRCADNVKVDGVKHPVDLACMEFGDIPSLCKAATDWLKTSGMKAKNVEFRKYVQT